MNDAENLAKLLGHLKPERFHAFMADEFGLLMPELTTLRHHIKGSEPFSHITH